MQRRTTLKDIAARVGVTISCVSLALRDSPEIAKTTKTRIRHWAEKLGYRPDPALSALAAYRSRSQPARFRSVLACVIDGPKDSVRDGNWAAFEARARELGYKAALFPLPNPAQGWRLLLRTLRARGIRGVFLAPRSRYDEAFPDAATDDFCFVTVGYSVRISGIHRVSTNQYGDMVRHVGALADRGYRRIGLWVPEAVDGRVNHQFSAGYLAAFLADKKKAPPIYRGEEAAPQGAREWARGNRLDAIIGLPSHCRILRDIGFPIPGALGFSTYNWHGGAEVSRMSGMNYRPERLVSGAMDALNAALLNNRTGLSDDAPLTLFHAQFIEGATARAREENPPAAKPRRA